MDLLIPQVGLLPQVGLFAPAMFAIFIQDEIGGVSMVEFIPLRHLLFHLPLFGLSFSEDLPI